MMKMSPSRIRVRGFFRGAVTRVATTLHRRGVLPDTVTYFTIFLAMIALLALALLHSEPIYGVLVFLVGFFDGVDGALARIEEGGSTSGALTDSVSDRVSEFILLFAIALAYSGSFLAGLPVSLWVMLCLMGWLMTSYTRSRAESLGVSDLDVGVGARSERLLTLVVFSLLMLLLWGLFTVTIMGLLTAAYRYHHYRNEIMMAQNEPADHHT
ncbi:MAG: CDP-alcohol phosphatidyltransferase family protein [Candidatus Thorarchaeota archaeon]